MGQSNKRQFPTTHSRKTEPIKIVVNTQDLLLLKSHRLHFVFTFNSKSINRKNPISYNLLNLRASILISDKQNTHVGFSLQLTATLITTSHFVKIIPIACLNQECDVLVQMAFAHCYSAHLSLVPIMLLFFQIV